MRIRGLAATICLGVALVAPPGAAVGRDSHAPSGASTNWLPCDAWVMFHWLPFDESRLYALLGMSRDQVRAWLRDDDHHTLAQLFARRGVVVRAAAARLAPAGKLRNRTIDALTQGHLAQHVLFHYFHQPLIASRAQQVFGIDPVNFRRLRLQGRSPAEIGRANGRTSHEIAQSALKLLTYAAHEGVRSHQTSKTQAATFLAIQRRGLGHWLSSHIEKPGAGGAWTPQKPSHMALLCFLLRGDTGSN